MGGCGLEGDVGAESSALLSVFHGHRTNGVMLAIRGRQEESLNAVNSRPFTTARHATEPSRFDDFVPEPSRSSFVNAPASHDAVIWCLADRSITVLPITSPKARSDPLSSSLVPTTRSTACCR